MDLDNEERRVHYHVEVRVLPDMVMSKPIGYIVNWTRLGGAYTDRGEAATIARGESRGRVTRVVACICPDVASIHRVEVMGYESA